MSQVVDEALLSARSEEENNERKAERALLRWPPFHAMHPQCIPATGPPAFRGRQHLTPSSTVHPALLIPIPRLAASLTMIVLAMSRPRFTFDVIARPLHVWRHRAAPEPAACLAP
jgi:hypothetical protein